MLSIIFAILLALPALPEQTLTENEEVLNRATEYVTKYEAELGNLIGSEEYVQNVAWLSRGRTSMVSRRQQRRTSSDFLILQVGPEWTGLRKVNRVDGTKVKEEPADFETEFDDSPAGNYKRLKGMIEESAQYNIGDVLRQINLPTFPLAVMRKEHIRRFSFEKNGNDKVEGVETWVFRFSEEAGPTLVHGGKGENLPAKGRLWIEPATGRILKTEFMVENHFEPEPLKARVVVTYAHGSAVNMLLPDLMLEEYQSGGSTITCRANYSNFRPFTVDVKFDIAPTKPPGGQQ